VQERGDGRAIDPDLFTKTFKRLAAGPASIPRRDCTTWDTASRRSWHAPVFIRTPSRPSCATRRSPSPWTSPRRNGTRARSRLRRPSAARLRWQQNGNNGAARGSVRGLRLGSLCRSVGVGRQGIEPW